MDAMEHAWVDRRATTLRDVAKSAGVSESTASVVLNGARSGTRVSAATRLAVMETAKQLGYRPNSIARSLQTGRTNRVGIYSGRARLDARNLFFAELLGGAFDGAHDLGFNTLIHTSGTSSNRLLDLVSSRSLDGLIVHARQDDPILPLLGELRIPAVAVADRIDEIPSVCVDDRFGGAMLAQHLAQLGHRNVLIKCSDQSARSCQDRIDSFVESMARLGGKCVLRSFLGEDYLDAEDVALLTTGESRCTAVFGWSDWIAERIYAGITSLGIRVPAEVAFVAFDGFQPFYPPAYQFTTIRAPWSDVGREAVHLLSKLIAGDSVPVVSTLPVEFVRGTTT